MIKKYYKISEFANLCGITKHTLYHYDEIGLLHPSITQDNGYRYYTIEQFEKFNIISVLKKAGTPLDEIQIYLKNLDTNTFLTVLRKKLDNLQEEAEKLEKMSSMLSNTISTMENYLNVQTDRIQIVECGEEYLVATKIPVFNQEDEKTMLQTIGNHLQYCLHHNFNFHVGEIVLEENMKQKNFRESYYYSRIYQKLDIERLFIKPKGCYAILYHQGKYDRLYQTYQDMKKQVEELGYNVIGNIYEEDLVDYLSEHNSEKYIQKISMQVIKL